MSGEPGMERAAFLSRISAALGRHGAPEPPGPAPTVNEGVARTAWPDQDLSAFFSERATAVGMVVHRCAGANAAPRVLDLLRDLKAQRVAVAGESTVSGIAAALKGAGFQIVDWRSAPGLEPLYSADVGVTDVQAGIAETGSLVCWSGPDRGRGLSLVPPVHIALVRRSDILPDLIDYWARHRSAAPADLPSSIVLITGPSKTADIEGELITGVHGPREVHIVLIDDA